MTENIGEEMEPICWVPYFVQYAAILALCGRSIELATGSRIMAF